MLAPPLLDRMSTCMFLLPPLPLPLLLAPPAPPLLLADLDHTGPCHVSLSHQVEFPDSRSTLCLLPAKFHKKLWIRKGSFLIVEDAPEASSEGHRVTGFVAAVLYADHVKQLRRMPGVW